jgi:hypothetical protein
MVPSLILQVQGKSPMRSITAPIADDQTERAPLNAGETPRPAELIASPTKQVRLVRSVPFNFLGQGKLTSP